jgi:hypothetical protein
MVIKRVPPIILKWGVERTPPALDSKDSTIVVRMQPAAPRNFGRIDRAGLGRLGVRCSAPTASADGPFRLHCGHRVALPRTAAGGQERSSGSF